MLSPHRKNFRPGLIKGNSRQTYFAPGVEWLTSARICEKSAHFKKVARDI